MEHHEHHHHHEHRITDATSRAFGWSIGLNSAYVIIEMIAGIANDSMGLVSDALHNLSDVGALLIALIAYRLSKLKPNAKYTYGYGNATIQASFVNSVILYMAVGVILVECIRKFMHPTAVDGALVAWIAAAGVLVNGLTAYILIRANSHDLNVKGAYMHMLADTLVSIGVVVSGVLIHFTGWYLLDPIVGLVIAFVIAWTSWDLLLSSSRIWLNGVPREIDIAALGSDLKAIPGVVEMHHIHVWALSTTVNAMTVHLEVESPAELDRVVAKAVDIAHAHHIQHPTIQVETAVTVVGHDGHELSQTI